MPAAAATAATTAMTITCADRITGTVISMSRATRVGMACAEVSRTHGVTSTNHIACAGTHGHTSTY